MSYSDTAIASGIAKIADKLPDRHDRRSSDEVYVRVAMAQAAAVIYAGPIGASREGAVEVARAIFKACGLEVRA